MIKNYTITVNGNVYDVTVEEKAQAQPRQPRQLRLRRRSRKQLQQLRPRERPARAESR